MSEQTTDTVTQTPRVSAAGLSALKILGWCAVVVALLTVDGQLQALYQGSLGRVKGLILPAFFLTELLKLKPVFLMAVVLLLADRRLRWRFASDFALVVLVQAGVASGLKDLFNRMRPDSVEGAGVFFGPMADVNGNSFPSGHATAAWALAALLAAYYPRWRWAFYVGAMAVCWARLQLGSHYPADLVFGGALGWFVAQGLLGWMKRVRARRAEHGQATVVIGETHMPG